MVHQRVVGGRLSCKEWEGRGGEGREVVLQRVVWGGRWSSEE